MHHLQLKARLAKAYAQWAPSALTRIGSSYLAARALGLHAYGNRQLQHGITAYTMHMNVSEAIYRHQLQHEIPRLQC